MTLPERSLPSPPPSVSTRASTAAVAAKATAPHRRKARVQGSREEEKARRRRVSTSSACSSCGKKSETKMCPKLSWKKINLVGISCTVVSNFAPGESQLKKSPQYFFLLLWSWCLELKLLVKSFLKSRKLHLWKFRAVHANTSWTVAFGMVNRLTEVNQNAGLKQLTG